MISNRELATQNPPSHRAELFMNSRIKLDLNNKWHFIKGDIVGVEAPDFSDRDWPQVELPHTWNARDGCDGDDYLYRGYCWYRRSFSLPEAQGANCVYVQFGAVNRECDVYVNGRLAGRHVGGYSRFTVDLTDLVDREGDNIMALRVTNRFSDDVPPLFSDSTPFGGILKKVHLILTGPLHVELQDFGSSGVYLTQSDVTAASAKVEAKVLVRNHSATAQEATVCVEIKDDRGRVVKSVEATQTFEAGRTHAVIQSVKLDKPRLWHGRNDPYLYRAEVTIRSNDGIEDVVSQPLGLRNFRVDADKGFFLNGEPYDLHGVSRTYDWEGMGRAVTRDQHLVDMELLLELGCTAVRAPLYDSAEEFYDLCDERGIIISAEIPLTNCVRLTEVFFENTKSQLVELIRQNYNHPCVVSWGLANEIRNHDKIRNADAPDPTAVLRRLNDVAHGEDPARMTNICTNGESCGAANWVADSTTWNMYNGWYGKGGYEDIGPRIDKVRADNPGRKIGMSEFGPGAAITLHSAAPKALDHTEEYQCLFHEAYWRVFAARPYLWVKYAWLLSDFASDHRDEGDRSGMNNKGLVTYDRKVRKDAFYWYKANWSSEYFIHITGRRFSPRPAEANTVKVYSNCERVELFLNGISCGAKDGSARSIVWEDLNFLKGDNLLEATGTSNGRRVSDCTVIAFTLSLAAEDCPAVSASYDPATPKTS